jgi:hypothetical protein
VEGYGELTTLFFFIIIQKQSRKNRNLSAILALVEAYLRTYKTHETE